VARTGFIEELDAVVKARWARIREGDFWQHVLEHGMDRELYRLTMNEIFHYTRHNAVNQAVAAGRCSSPEDLHLLKFVFEHADEELGHEKMIVHDLASIGLTSPEETGDAPLAPTQALIGYLDHVALVHGARARLGYSYWAESSYDELDPVLSRARADLNLADENMTFFVAHSTIDAKHAEEVLEAIVENIVTAEDEEAVKQVADTTLYLTGQLMEAALERHVSGPVTAVAARV
jgi:hypothetical protein